jgi:aspartyl-tRNA(Asn)/glutamyl-tRNA(Gln) amidotransferase subunit B
MQYEVVIGLEIHAQLKTESKVFCGCKTIYGNSPNSQTCPICLGMPGTLPVLNEKVIEFAAKAGLALECKIRLNSRTARKNYFYPDLSKGYQISQYDEPMCEFGKIEIFSGEDRAKVLGITRIHIEEDSGKSVHGFGDKTAVDFNRCGTGLIEIVSEPDMRSPEEARAYLVKLKQILEYLEVSDCNMEEGSLRVDANISLRPFGQKELGTKTEMKNMNSFRAVEKALYSEIERQGKVLDNGGEIQQVTMLWNENLNQARVMRTKEDAHDYRYFPEPDLLPIEITEGYLADIKSQLPELPDAKMRRFSADYKLGKEAISTLVLDKNWSAWFEEVVQAGSDPVEASKWVTVEVLRVIKERLISIDEFPISPLKLSQLIKEIEKDSISKQAGKKVFDHMLDDHSDVSLIIEKLGLKQVSDTRNLEVIIRDIKEKYSTEVSRFQNGESKLLGFFMGQVMKESQGKANPKIIAPLIQKIIGD